MTQTRKPDEEKVVPRTVGLRPSLIQQVQEQAAREGHHNFSHIIVKAVLDYLARHRGKKAA